MTANAFGTGLTSPDRGSRRHSDIVERSAYGMYPSVTASVLITSLPVANLPVLEVTRLTNTMNATESAQGKEGSALPAIDDNVYFSISRSEFYNYYECGENVFLDMIGVFCRKFCFYSLN